MIELQIKGLVGRREVGCPAPLSSCCHRSGGRTAWQRIRIEFIRVLRLPNVNLLFGICRIMNHDDADRAQGHIFHVADRVVVIEPHSGGRRPRFDRARVVLARCTCNPCIVESGCRRHAIPLFELLNVKQIPQRVLRPHRLRFVLRRKRVGAIVNGEESKPVRMQTVCAHFHGQWLLLRMGHRFCLVARNPFYHSVWLETVRSVAWFPSYLCACGMHYLCGGFCHGMCAHVKVAKMDDHLVAHVAFDHRAGNCAHRAFIGWVRLIKVPRIYLPIIRNRPWVGMALTRRQVTPQDERVHYLAITVLQRLEHRHFPRLPRSR